MELSNAQQMHSAINQLGLTGKPFSFHSILNELAGRGINPNQGFRAMIEDHLRNMLDQEFIILVGNSEPSPHPGLFQASELFRDLGSITPNCIEEGINLSSIAVSITLADLKKQLQG